MMCLTAGQCIQVISLLLSESSCSAPGQDDKGKEEAGVVPSKADVGAGVYMAKGDGSELSIAERAEVLRLLQPVMTQRQA
jgi:hypothetical protein